MERLLALSAPQPALSGDHTDALVELARRFAPLVLGDQDLAERLAIAISGRGAFCRFKDVLGRRPGELEAWCAFSDDRERDRARAWLVAAGCSARVPGRPTAP